MFAGRGEDCGGLLGERAGAEEECHYEGVWEADFGAIDETITEA